MKKQLITLFILIAVFFCGCGNVNTKENLETSASQETTSTETYVDDTDTKLIALTFDDGPSIYTERILDVLKKYDSKATFFVLGNRIKGNEDILNRMINEGHEIGSHTWSHKDLTTMKEDQIKKQLKSTKNKIYKVTGYNSPYIRPPYGEWNKKIKKYCKEDGLSIIKWNVDPLDWKYKSPKKISKNIVNNAKDGRIVLCHDIYEKNIEALNIAIPKLLEQGYKFVNITDLLTSYDGVISPGKVYYNRWEIE